MPQGPTGLLGNAAAVTPFLAGALWQCVLQGTIPSMARPRYTTQLTFRLASSLRDDLEREAQAKGDDLGELVRDILADHAARQSVERTRP